MFTKHAELIINYHLNMMNVVSKTMNILFKMHKLMI